MYGTSNVTADSNSRPFLTAGINKDFTLSSVVMENSKQDGSGKEVLTFTFAKTDSGATFRKMFWEVNPEYVIKLNKSNPRKHNRSNERAGFVKGETITDAQAIQMAADEFNRHIKHIMTKFMTEEEATIEDVNSYNDFCNKVIAKFKGKTEGKLVNLKLIYNYRDYLDFPRFGNFIELSGTTPETLFVDVSRDKVKKSQPTSSDRVSAAVAVSDDPNDLPF